VFGEVKDGSGARSLRPAQQWNRTSRQLNLQSAVAALTALLAGQRKHEPTEAGTGGQVTEQPPNSIKHRTEVSARMPVIAAERKA
jgi:hypothetical protein